MTEVRGLIEIRDTVFVDAPPDVLWRWLETLPEHYLEWHPDHLGARWLRGGGAVPGAVLESREVLHGRPHRLRMRITEVEPGRLVRYRVTPGLGGGFEVLPAEEGSQLTASICVGFGGRFLGPALDPVLRRLLKERLAAIARHQAEEGANLKALLEKA